MQPTLLRSQADWMSCETRKCVRRGRIKRQGRAENRHMQQEVRNKNSKVNPSLIFKLLDVRGSDKMFHQRNKHAQIMFTFQSFHRAHSDWKAAQRWGEQQTFYGTINQQNKHLQKYLVPLMWTNLAPLFLPCVLIKHYPVMYSECICTFCSANRSMMLKGCPQHVW